MINYFKHPPVSSLPTHTYDSLKYLRCCRDSHVEKYSKASWAFLGCKPTKTEQSDFSAPPPTGHLLHILPAARSDSAILLTRPASPSAQQCFCTNDKTLNCLFQITSYWVRCISKDENKNILKQIKMLIIRQHNYWTAVPWADHNKRPL